MPKANFDRQPMPEQEAEVRARNFEEVNLGFPEAIAIKEAERCLQCKNMPCRDGCPVGIDIGGFINLLRMGDLRGSSRIMKKYNNLPAICGRVCPQESQCEKLCVYAKKGVPVGIGRLERFIADWEISDGVELPEVAKSTGKKVAVVGSGPSGMTAAADLARYGHRVVVYEALHRAGGVLTYGIPPFRLPRLVAETELQNVQKLGVELKTDWIVGKTITVDEILAEGYDAVFLGTGAGLPQFLNIPGENLAGVYSANEFLTRINLMKAYRFPEFDTPVRIGKRIAVVGAGNVAMDSARCALRLSPEQVYIVYRRSRTEMPARVEELHHAEEEGIIFKLLTNPVQILDNGKGAVAGLECQEMELGEPDASGRRRPIPKEGTNFVLDVDTVIMAIGTTPNPLVPQTTMGLETSRHGTIVADGETGRTTKDRVWAGGDIVTGAATVIEAMGAGKRAAASINAYLRGE